MASSLSSAHSCGMPLVLICSLRSSEQVPPTMCFAKRASSLSVQKKSSALSEARTISIQIKAAKNTKATRTANDGTNPTRSSLGTLRGKMQVSHRASGQEPVSQFRFQTAAPPVIRAQAARVGQVVSQRSFSRFSHTKKEACDDEKMFSRSIFWVKSLNHSMTTN